MSDRTRFDRASRACGRQRYRRSVPWRRRSGDTVRNNRCVVSLRPWVVGHDWQLEEKDRAAERAAAIADAAVVRANDVVAHRQAKPGALADRLGRVERLEQFGFVFG